MNIGVIGNGFVGQATQIFSQCPQINCLVYDIDPNKCHPPGTTCEDLALQSDLIFICVPTPMNTATGQCDTSIVQNSIQAVRAFNTKAIIIVRSTVPPGTCISLNVCHMPEYLTEANWRKDFIQTKKWYLGTVAEQRERAQTLLSTLLNLCKNVNAIQSSNLVVCDSRQTEAAKYFRNALLAARVSICNEFSQYCAAIDIDYNDVRQMIIDDERIGSSHTSVPGPDGNTGFGGTCLPKDLSSLISAMKSSGVNSIVLNAVQLRNNTVDRAGKQEWLNAVGRSVSEKT